MKYVAIICICFSVFLIPPFQYIYPLIICATIYLEAPLYMILLIGCSVVYLFTDFVSFYLLMMLYISLLTIRQYLMLKGKPLYEQYRYLFSITLCLFLTIYQYSTEFTLLASLSLYFIYPLLTKNIWIILWAFPCMIQFEYQTEYILTYLLTMIILLGKNALPLFIFLYGIQLDPSYYGLFLLCIIFYQLKKETLLILCGSLFLLENQFLTTIMVLPSIFCLLFYDFKEIKTSSSSLLNGILPLLIQFYEERNVEICALLKSLYRVYLFNKASLTKTEDDLKKILQEYGYVIKNISLQQSVAVSITLESITRGEICGPLLALVSNYLKEDYQVASCMKINHGYQVRFESCPRYLYEWDCVSFAMQQESGDAYRIFRCKEDVIALLCDGMGNGIKAQECSSLAIRLFHHLCEGGMAMEDMIHCINAMMQSERFTTMDVLRLSTQHNVAQIVKSAACPTLLYRNGQIIELSSNALPLGIVSSLDVNVQSFTIQDNDVFFLLSDGFCVEKVKEWILTYQLMTKQGFHQFQALKKQLKDDATMIKIHVHENTHVSCNL